MQFHSPPSRPRIRPQGWHDSPPPSPPSDSPPSDSPPSDSPSPPPLFLDRPYSPHRHRFRRQTRSKAQSIPVEILSEIFILVSQFPGDNQWNWRALMLVCQDWHDIILSTPGLHSQLRIRRATQKEVVRVFILRRKTRLDVTVDMNDEGDGSNFNAENFHACFMAAIQVASRWSSLTLISPPPHGEYKHLQILQPLTHLESLKLACGFSEFFEPLMTAISQNAPPNLTEMVLADPAAVLRITQPACSHIYHSLTTLKIQLPKRMDSHADILPHLHRLETLDACRLSLPFYSPDITLPLIHTLRFLYLKSVSVQWMAGHVLPAIKKCHIIFPHNADTIDAFQPVTMPSCSLLIYNSNDFHPLSQFHLPSLDTLDVKNAQWNVWRGDPQLASLCPILAATPQCLTLLRLDVQCNERLLAYMLKLAPVLEELWLGLAHPNVLSKTFFQAFITRDLHADSVSEMAGPPSHTIAPLCPLLKLLHLHYRRWMRGPDKMALVVVLSDVVGSRQLETESSFSLSLSFDEAHGESHWTIGKPVRKSQYTQGTGLVVVVSTRHSIIPMTKLLPEHGLASIPFKKPESLYVFVGDYTSFDLFSVRDPMKLMVYYYARPPQPPSLPCALPGSYSLRVLDIKCNDASFLGGHTFHKLERCRLLQEGRSMHGPHKHMLTEIGMPICTRVNIEDPWVLAAIKLPQIRELALDFSEATRRVIWEKHIAVNANLSGLNLLHMKNWPDDGDLVPILRSVPLLETLIITSWRGIASFAAFLPMGTNVASGRKQTSAEGRTLAVLCPRLQNLQIEIGHDSVQPWHAPILRDIVALRAEYGSPLTVFTFSQFRRWPAKSKVELIGRDGSFNMESVVLPKSAGPFSLGL